MKVLTASLLIILFLFNICIAGTDEINSNEPKIAERKTNDVKGKVTDSKTNEPLPGVNLYLVGTFRGAATAHDGTFKIENVPVGKYTIRVGIIGYESVEEEIEIKVGREIEMAFSLNPSILEMSEVVVTATGLPTLYKNVPVKTNVVPRRLIEAQKVNNLAEALDFQTGVRVEQNCTNCNFAQVRILGMEGHHAQILIDNDPVISSLAAVYGLEHFPDEMIEKVEIVKGGNSALYGGSAVAGVVNLITRRPTHNEISFDYRNGSINGDLDHKTGVTISRVSNSGKSGGYLFGTLRRKDPYDHNGDGFSEIVKLHNEAVGLNWFFKPQTNSELAVRLHYIHEDRRGGNKFDLEPHFADIAEAIETWRYGGSAAWTQAPSVLFNYKAYVSIGYTKRDTYYGAEQDPNAYGTSNSPLVVTGLQSNYRLSNHTLTAGIQYTHEDLKDEAIAYNRIIDATYTDFGFIAQDQIELGDNKAELVIGSRLDKHSEISDPILSPRVALRWSITAPLVFRGGMSTGFKPPEVFNEDLAIEQVGGEGKVIRNVDDLKEERSNTFYSGLEFQDFVGDMGLRLSVNGFYTSQRNSFQLDERDDPNTADQTEFYRINSGGAEIKGVEAEIGLRIGKGEITGGMTFQSSKWDDADPDFNSYNIFRTPNNYGSLRFSYDISRRISLLAVSKYTGPMYAPHFAGYIDEDRLEKTPSFLTFDLIGSYEIPIWGHSYLIITAGVYNITDSFQNDFDKGTYRDPGYVYGPLTPRRLLFALSIGH